MPSSEPAFEVGLLSPVTVGHDAGVSDAAIAAALVEVEVALARASAKVGIVPAAAAEAIASALAGFEMPLGYGGHRRYVQPIPQPLYELEIVGQPVDADHHGEHHPLPEGYSPELTALVKA